LLTKPLTTAAVAMLRTSAGRDPHDKQLHDLVGELSTRSDEFRRRWSAHDVRIHSVGTKHFHHHIVGRPHSRLPKRRPDRRTRPRHAHLRH
jgi:hypothetical protein